ncbi:MAG: type ISP restriction/modification enzyme [Sphingorhabdus sp.]
MCPRRLAVSISDAELLSKISRFASDAYSDDETRAHFFPGTRAPSPSDKRAWKLGAARLAVRSHDASSNIKAVAYRPFDSRFIYYRPEVVDWGRQSYMRHMQQDKNLALAVCRQAIDDSWTNVFLSDRMGDDSYVSNRSKERGYYFPLYLYSDEGSLETSARVNFDPRIYAEIKKRAGLIPPRPSTRSGGEGDHEVVEGSHIEGSDKPIDGTPPSASPPPPRSGEDLSSELPDELKVFDYIYGVLHSPDYRRTYAQFWKIDFPRIPYPASPEVFAHIADKGGQLRRLHLMEDAAIGATPYPFRGEGDNVVVKPAFAQNPSPLAGEGGAPSGAEGEGAGASAIQQINGAQTRADPPPQPSPARGEGAVGASTSTLTNISTACRKSRGNFTSAGISLHRNG